jgi:hypothetical protein
LRNGSKERKRGGVKGMGGWRRALAECIGEEEVMEEGTK